MDKRYSMRALGDEAHLAEQPGLGQYLRPAECIALCCDSSAIWWSEYALVRRQQTISDLPICPLIRHFDLQLVRARLECVSYVDLVRRRPCDPHGNSVHHHFRNVAYLAEIEIDALARVEP